MKVNRWGHFYCEGGTNYTFFVPGVNIIAMNGSFVLLLFWLHRTTLDHPARTVLPWPYTRKHVYSAYNSLKAHAFIDGMKYVRARTRALAYRNSYASTKRTSLVPSRGWMGI